MQLKMRPYVLVALAACSGESTGVDDSSLEYRGPIAGTFAEAIPGPAQCTVYSTLSGTVRVRLRKQDDLDGAEAGVDIVERVIGASPGCGSSREVRPFGEWTAPISGTASQFSFVVSRNSPSQTTTIQFVGSLSNGTINGVITYSRSGTAGSGRSEYPVSLQVSSSEPGPLGGTWGGSLTLTLDGASAAYGTSLVLAGSGSTVTGQLHLEGGEVMAVEGTVAGSTLAITATPRPAADNCNRYSLGITFLIGTNQLRATSAAGTACDAGGRTLRQLSAASGVLNRS